MSQTFTALQNFDTEFQELLERFGGSVVIVAFDSKTDSPVWKINNIAQTLAAELQPAGRFDSCVVRGEFYFCCYHMFDLPVALLTLKQSLESRGLLDLARILVGEPDNKGFRVYWPATAELV